MSAGCTVAEKILAQASGRDRVRPGEFVVAQVDRLLIPGRRFAEFARTAGRVWDPERVVVVFDHVAPPPTVAAANYFAAARRTARELGIRHWYEIGQGICHQVFLEEGFARPGELVVGSDSHTCTAGALGAAARGINVETPYVLAYGETWFRVPESIRFVLTGKLSPGVGSKDVVLFIAGKYGEDVGLYKSIEYAGPALEAMSLESRIVFANMGIELGAKFAILPADEVVLDYVRARTDEPFEPVHTDPDAHYESVYEIDLSGLEPLVACPHDVGNVKPVGAVAGTKIDQAFIGSCTNARYEDLEAAARILRGREVHPETRLIVTPASKRVYDQALRAGIIEVLSAAGAVITSSDCGACPGFHMGLLGDGEVCIASQNRNYQGRMGSATAQIYLASAATVAASAVAGRIADPRAYLS
jgi:3-isopropylmalate/(R)-2-methylmalate dehydratase large subunit